MKTKSTNKNLPKWLIVTSIAIVLIGGYTVFAKSTNVWPFDSTKDQTTHEDTSHPSHSDTDTSDATQDIQPSTPPDKTPTQYSPPKDGSTTPKDELTGIINYKSTQDGSLTLRTTINQQLSSGTCDLILKNQSSNKTVERSANIVASPSASNCDGFDVPLSALGAGTWDITINLTSGSKHGSLTDQVTISS